MILPQRPYFPIAPLAAAVAYPAEPGTYDAARVAELIAAVGLPDLAPRIEEEAHWNRMLSLGEQQRLGIARALLHAPDYLFLDEATASLDEPSEAALYHLLEQRLSRRDHRIDRPPLDARRIPPPPAGVQPRRRSLLGARGQPGGAGGLASVRRVKIKRAAAHPEPPPVEVEEAVDRLI